MAKSLIDQSEIRVVITPTDSGDVQAERDYLREFVFPHLSHLGEERDIIVNFLWTAPLFVQDVHKYLVSYTVADNPHRYAFILNTTGNANKERHFVDGVATYEYENKEELGRGIEKGLRRVLDKLFPSTSVTDLVKNLRRVARIYQEMGQLQDALDMQSRVFKVLDKEFGEKNTDTIETLYTCGWLNYKLGNYEQALKQLKRSYENAKDVYGDTDQRTTDQLGIIRMVEASAKRHKK